MPKHQTLLGFDFGMRKIGVAVGQTITATASPLTTLYARNGVPDWLQVKKLAAKWSPDALVVGIPLTPQGEYQEVTTKAREFAGELNRRCNLPVFLVDERYTTVEARQFLFDQGGFRHLQKSQIDSFAAKVILEDWLKQYVKNLDEKF